MACDSEAIFANKFSFDSESFYKCFLLYMRPHEKLAGIQGASFAAVIMFLLFLPIHGMFILSIANHEFLIDSSDFLICIFIGSLDLIFTLQIVNGLIMFSGVKRPKVKGKRWIAKTKYAFHKLATTKCSSPFLEISNSSSFLGTFPTRFTLGWCFGYGKHDRPRFYDHIPYISPSLKSLAVPSGLMVPRSIDFQTTITHNSIVKGSREDGVTFSFDQVYDIFEWKKIPEYAIVRMKNEEDQIIIRKDAFTKGTYEEFASFVRSRITVEEPAVFKKINERIEKRKKKGK